MYGSQFAAQLGICMGPNLVSSVAPPYPLFGQDPPLSDGTCEFVILVSFIGCGNSWM